MSEPKKVGKCKICGLPIFGRFAERGYCGDCWKFIQHLRRQADRIIEEIAREDERAEFLSYDEIFYTYLLDWWDKEVEKFRKERSQSQLEEES